MRKGFLQRFGAVCIGSAITLGTVAFNGVKLETAGAADTDDYAKLLQYSLYFYDANMCGNIDSVSALNWRGDCHTDDPVVGGYHDAGDHAMFGLPQGYTASTLGWSYYEYKDVFDELGLTGHFKTISKHFTDFFKDSTELSGDSVSRLLYGKGDGNVDHNYWGPPESQPSRASEMYYSSNGASDIAAEYAAALALDYINFGDAESLKYAEALYKFSTQYNQVATEGVGGFYSSSGCTDDQAWAAGWLYLATQNESYKQDCASKQAQYLGWVHSWDNVQLGAACLYAEITDDWSKVNSWLGQYTGNDNYFFLNEWGSARINASMQLTTLIAAKHSGQDYNGWVKGQMNFLLGENPKNTCFVVGFADNSAKNPHHRAASGYSNYDEMGDSGVTGPNGHVLVGALVGGPQDATGNNYEDTMKNYVCNEVAIDYNAGLVGAAAGLYSVYKTGATVDSIPGVDDVEIDTPEGSETTAPSESDDGSGSSTTSATSPDAPQPGSDTAELTLGDSYNYNDLKDMIGFPYEDFGLTAETKAKLKKVEVNISANNLKMWQGAFGTSTTVDPEYWTQSEDMSQNFSSNTGTITWDVPSEIADIIQYGYGGELKIGFWWIEPSEFTIDSVKLYFDQPISGSTTATTSSSELTTTTTANGNSSQAMLGDVDCNGRIAIQDAVLMARLAASDTSVTVTEQGKINAQMDGNSEINVDDLAILLKMIAGSAK